MQIKKTVSRKKIVTRVVVTLVTLLVIAGLIGTMFWVMNKLGTCTATYVRHTDGAVTKLGCGAE